MAGDAVEMKSLDEIIKLVDGYGEACGYAACPEMSEMEEAKADRDRAAARDAVLNALRDLWEAK
jgi:hypothetical protein